MIPIPTLRQISNVPGLGLTMAAERLAGRPMSDAAWVVNEAARLAVKSSKDEIDDICLFKACFAAQMRFRATILEPDLVRIACHRVHEVEVGLAQRILGNCGKETMIPIPMYLTRPSAKFQTYTTESLVLGQGKFRNHFMGPGIVRDAVDWCYSADAASHV